MARSIAVALWPPSAGEQQRVPPAEHAVGQRIAFAPRTPAIVTHLPEQGTASRQVATTAIAQDPRAASIEEDAQRRKTARPFNFAPQMLRPIELVLNTTPYLLHGSIDVQPPRPKLVYLPLDTEGGRCWLFA